MRFGKKGKLATRYIGPFFFIIERIDNVSYRLELPAELERIHDVFHISMLRKYIPDSSHVLPLEKLELNENATYKTQPIQILDRKEQVLRRKTIPLVKVLWLHHNVEEATWELESEIRSKYPHLFD